MRKFFALILVVLLSVSLFAACASFPPEISANKEKEIEEAWLAQKGYELEWFSYSRIGVRYYGTYNDYDILFYPHSLVLDMPSSQTIAGKSFISGSRFYLYAYRDGEFHDLKTIYADGLIDDDDISKIARMHQKYEEIR